MMLLALALVAGSAGPAAASPELASPLCGDVFGSAVSGLAVKKRVFCDLQRDWVWSILKSADQSALTLATGQVFPVNYDVQVDANSTESFHVEAEITLRNFSAAPIEVTGVSDNLGPVSCPVSFPYLLPAGDKVTCMSEATLTSAPSDNTATATATGDIVASVTVPIDWSQATVSETDECVDVSDSFEGALGTVCADGDSSFTFNYTHTIGPYQACGDFTVDNTATFTSNDSGSTGSASWTVNVNVPCAGGCSLTPGYWKTHSSYGPAPYDNTWASLGENTTFFLSGKTYYQVLWTNPSGGNAYYILAHAYIAAVLNNLNGADTSAVSSQIAHAAALFATYTPTSTLSRAVRADFIATAGILDKYNNGVIGPGHCSE